MKHKENSGHKLENGAGNYSALCIYSVIYLLYWNIFTFDLLFLSWKFSVKGMVL